MLLAGAGLAAASTPTQAAGTLVPRVSGLPWASGVNGSSGENNAFTAWRGGRKLDVRTVFFGMRDWAHLSSSSGALSYQEADGAVTACWIASASATARSRPSASENGRAASPAGSGTGATV